jgi:hypothetical protein
MEHTVFDASIGRYIRNMGQKSQKKSEQVLVMLVPEMYAELQSIAAGEDRPLGYVARELMIRGLGLYQIDGKLKAEPAEAGKVVASIAPGSIEEARELYERNIAQLTDAKAKPRKVPHLGEISDGNAKKKRKTG